jgi:hypothetical protein
MLDTREGTREGRCKKRDVKIRVEAKSMLNHCAIATVMLRYRCECAAEALSHRSKICYAIIEKSQGNSFTIVAHCEVVAKSLHYHCSSAAQLLHN